MDDYCAQCYIDSFNEILNLSDDPSELLFYALDHSMTFDTIKDIAKIKPCLSKSRVYSVPSDYVEYPLSVALLKGLSLDYIKLLYARAIPDTHIIGLLFDTKPSDNIVEYLLGKLDNITYLDDWKLSKWDAEFWALHVTLSEINYDVELD